MILIAIFLTIVFCIGAIDENIKRNQKLGDDPQAKAWHRSQWLQWASFFIAVSVFGWQYGVWRFELPLAVLFWMLFNGFNNLYTFNREWWYVGNLQTRKAFGSAIDQFFLNRKNPVRAMQVAQFTALLLSLIPLALHYLL